MDFDSLKNQVSNLTLYDLKAGVRKVQNAVMNYTEMEAKVREATNNDPWGASASLMQEIASGTHNYQLLNEIMPLIYKRFTDKTAEEWRQIYKSLQLLEYLVKNGSERVIDDARSHLSLLRMLRQFHYIDQNGKDQGVNVRNRAQELAKLLSDVDAIRTERKKARANRSKFGGVEGGPGLGGFSSNSNSRYGGFGSETGNFGGGYQGEVYGDGGGFGGRETDFSDTQRRGEAFEEYDEGDDEGAPPSRTTASRSTASRATATSVKRESQKQKQKEPDRDLFDFGDEPITSASAGKTAAASSNVLDDFGPTQSSAAGDDDDFDDFQSATSPSISQPPSSIMASFSPPPTLSTTTSATRFAAPKPVAPAQAANLQDLFATTSPARSTGTLTPVPTSSTLSSPPPQPQAQAQPIRSATYQSSGPNYYTSVPALAPSTSSSAFSSQPTTSAPSYGGPTTAASLGKPAAKPAATSAGGDVFGSLWSTASSTAGVNRAATPKQSAALADLAKQKSSAGIWGTASSGNAGLGVGAGQRPGAIAPSSNSMATGGASKSSGTALGNGLDDLLG